MARRNTLSNERIEIRDNLKITSVLMPTGLIVGAVIWLARNAVATCNRDRSRRGGLAVGNVPSKFRGGKALGGIGTQKMAVTGTSMIGRG